MKTPVASSEANVWQLVREIPSGDAGIRFEYDSTDDEISGYLVFDDGVNTPLKVKILTPSDIPSSSGVVSINGQTGVVTLYGSSIAVSSQDSTKIDAALAALDAKTGADIDVSGNDSTKISAALSALGAADTALATEDTNIKGSIAYNEDGNTATQNIPQGSFVVWKGHAYTASAAISSGDTLSTSTNLTAITNGIANELNSKLKMVTCTIPSAGQEQSFSYPSGYAYNNCMIIGASFEINSIYYPLTTLISLNGYAILKDNGVTIGSLSNVDSRIPGKTIYIELLKYA